MSLYNIVIRFLACCAAIAVTQGNEEKQIVAIGGDDQQTVNAYVNFFLWTRRNPTTQQELLVGDVPRLRSSSYVSTNPTIIYVHGFTENGLNFRVLTLRDSFLRREEVNFISVNWMFLSSGPDYKRAAANVQPVGIRTAEFVQFLLAQGSDITRFHLVGFSLGAHVVGQAGATTGGIIPRITGLDPAGPLFEKADARRRLDPTDANFVDVIHTNAGLIISGKIGTPLSSGHVDFWPNGGSVQPGCIGSGTGSLSDLLNLYLTVGCSHFRAVAYFNESINGIVPFTATRCDSYLEFRLGLCVNNARTSMGFPVSNLARGSFFLDTNAQPPYARG